MVVASWLVSLVFLAGDDLRPGRSFRDALRDGGAGPEMRVVPGGTFVLGSAPGEPGRKANEGPAQQVTLAAFAVGRTEVTRGQFAAFAKATGYLTDAERDTPVGSAARTPGCFAYAEAIAPEWLPGTSWRRHGFPQDDSHPVTCVSWNDAVAYVDWLRAQTGKRYRLPTEAELEYIARAGTRTPWYWGTDEDGGCGDANGADEDGEAGIGERFGWHYEFMYAKSDCADGHVYTAPVGSFAPNAFGLYDTVGNVYEWAQDCYRPTHAGASPDGSAFVRPECTQRVLRSSTFNDQPEWLRSAARLAGPPASRYQNFGLRVARDP